MGCGASAPPRPEAAALPPPSVLAQEVAKKDARTASKQAKQSSKESSADPAAATKTKSDGAVLAKKKRVSTGAVGAASAPVGRDGKPLAGGSKAKRDVKNLLKEHGDPELAASVIQQRLKAQNEAKKQQAVYAGLKEEKGRVGRELSEAEEKRKRELAARKMAVSNSRLTRANTLYKGSQEDAAAASIQAAYRGNKARAAEGSHYQKKYAHQGSDLDWFQDEGASRSLSQNLGLPRMVGPDSGAMSPLLRKSPDGLVMAQRMLSLTGASYNIRDLRGQPALIVDTTKLSLKTRLVVSEVGSDGSKRAGLVAVVLKGGGILPSFNILTPNPVYKGQPSTDSEGGVKLYKFAQVQERSLVNQDTSDRKGVSSALKAKISGRQYRLCPFVEQNARQEENREGEALLKLDIKSQEDQDFTITPFWKEESSTVVGRVSRTGSGFYKGYSQVTGGAGVDVVLVGLMWLCAEQLTDLVSGLMQSKDK